jgi:hypothetical protein
MPLSKRDQQFYEEKLSLKSTGYLFLYTCLVGTILVPVTLFIQDASAGQAGSWNSKLVVNLAVEGFLLGCVVAVIMYLGFKFLLQMGWLPSRR